MAVKVRGDGFFLANAKTALLAAWKKENLYLGKDFTLVENLSEKAPFSELVETISKVYFAKQDNSSYEMASATIKVISQLAKGNTSEAFESEKMCKKKLALLSSFHSLFPTKILKNDSKKIQQVLTILLAIKNFLDCDKIELEIGLRKLKIESELVYQPVKKEVVNRTDAIYSFYPTFPTSAEGWAFLLAYMTKIQFSMTAENQGENKFFAKELSLEEVKDLEENYCNHPNQEIKELANLMVKWHERNIVSREFNSYAQEYVKQQQAPLYLLLSMEDEIQSLIKQTSPTFHELSLLIFQQTMQEMDKIRLGTYSDNLDPSYYEKRKNLYLRLDQEKEQLEALYSILWKELFNFTKRKEAQLSSQYQ
ncbi:MAG: hypothetical protein ACM3JI_05080, partial [Anaerolineae bacterium]